MSTAFAIPVEGVWIKPLTESAAHPLDRFIDGVRELSDEAFEAVYQETVDGLVSFAYGMVSDRRTAEDIVQESFLELVNAAKKLRGDGRSLSAWLYKSVRFGCLDEYRRRRRRPEIPAGELPDLPDASSLTEGFDPELEEALGALNKRQRQLILLRHVADLDGAEIAVVMRMTRKAVYAALSRAEEKLRSELGAAT